MIAAISYEIIRFSGLRQNWWLAKQMAIPGLLLQRLTTRQPDDEQIEVAITAMEAAIAADAGQPYQVRFSSPSSPEIVEDGANGQQKDSADEPAELGVPSGS